MGALFALLSGLRDDNESRSLAGKKKLLLRLIFPESKQAHVHVQTAAS